MCFRVRVRVGALWLGENFKVSDPGIELGFVVRVRCFVVTRAGLG